MSTRSKLVRCLVKKKGLKMLLEGLKQNSLPMMFGKVFHTGIHTSSLPAGVHHYRAVIVLSFKLNSK
jgi:hypothetical protein